MVPLTVATGIGLVLYAAGCWRLRATLSLTSLRAVLPRGMRKENA